MASIENNNLEQEVSHADEKPHGQVREVTAASVALAAAVAEQKPNLWSPNMIKLYMIMSIGYRYVCSLYTSLVQTSLPILSSCSLSVLSFPSAMSAH